MKAQINRAAELGLDVSRSKELADAACNLNTARALTADEAFDALVKGYKRTVYWGLRMHASLHGMSDGEI
jgi:hypothetical protein